VGNGAFFLLFLLRFDIRWGIFVLQRVVCCDAERDGDYSTTNEEKKKQSMLKILSLTPSKNGFQTEAENACANIATTALGQQNHRPKKSIQTPWMMPVPFIFFHHVINCSRCGFSDRWLNVLVHREHRVHHRGPGGPWGRETLQRGDVGV